MSFKTLNEVKNEIQNGDEYIFIEILLAFIAISFLFYIFGNSIVTSIYTYFNNTISLNTFTNILHILGYNVNIENNEKIVLNISIYRYCLNIVVFILSLGLVLKTYYTKKCCCLFNNISFGLIMYFNAIFFIINTSLLFSETLFIMFIIYKPIEYILLFIKNILNNIVNRFNLVCAYIYDVIIEFNKICKNNDKKDNC